MPKLDWEYSRNLHDHSKNWVVTIGGKTYFSPVRAVVGLCFIYRHDLFKNVCVASIVADRFSLQWASYMVLRDYETVQKMCGQENL